MFYALGARNYELQCGGKRFGLQTPNKVMVDNLKDYPVILAFIPPLPAFRPNQFPLLFPCITWGIIIVYGFYFFDFSSLLPFLSSFTSSLAPSASFFASSDFCFRTFTSSSYVDLASFLASSLSSCETLMRDCKSGICDKACKTIHQHRSRNEWDDRSTYLFPAWDLARDKTFQARPEARRCATRLVVYSLLRFLNLALDKFSELIDTLLAWTILGVTNGVFDGFPDGCSTATASKNTRVVL